VLAILALFGSEPNRPFRVDADAVAAAIQHNTPIRTPQGVSER
jgi:hypothetical protein